VCVCVGSVYWVRVLCVYVLSGYTVCVCVCVCICVCVLSACTVCVCRLNLMVSFRHGVDQVRLEVCMHGWRVCVCPCVHVCVCVFYLVCVGML